MYKPQQKKVFICKPKSPCHFTIITEYRYSLHIFSHMLLSYFAERFLVFFFLFLCPSAVHGLPARSINFLIAVLLETARPVLSIHKKINPDFYFFFLNNTQSQICLIKCCNIKRKFFSPIH